MADRTSQKILNVGFRVGQHFRSSVQCGICCEVKELRLLPCQHAICLDCLNAIMATPFRWCAYCREHLKEDSGKDYPVFRFVSNLQETVSNAVKALSPWCFPDTTRLRCCVKICYRYVDMYCKNCDQFLCYRCSKSHNTGALVEYDEQSIGSCQKIFQTWKDNLQSEVDSLNEEKDEILGKSKSKEKNDTSELVEHVEKQLSLHKLLMESSEAKRKLANTATDLFRLVHRLPEIKGQPSCYPPCEVKP